MLRAWLVSCLISLSPVQCFSWPDSVAPFHAVQPAPGSESKHQALPSILALKDMFYASDTVLPVDFCDTSSRLALVDVSHRDDDGETGEFCSHEGGHRRVPAAPSPPPLQLPLAAAHAVGSHPAQGQGALHLQVRTAATAGTERSGFTRTWRGRTELEQSILMTNSL